MRWAAAVAIAAGIGASWGLPAWGGAREGFVAAGRDAGTSPVPSGIAIGPVSGIKTHWLGGQSRSFLVPDASSTVWLREIRPETLEGSVQTREVATASTRTEVHDQLVPANFLHQRQTADLDVTVKRIRAKTLWEQVAGWVAPIATVALAVGLALALPASGLLIAGTAAAAIAVETAGAWLASHPAAREVKALPPDASALSVSYQRLVQAQQGWRLAAAIAGARSNGVELQDGTSLADFDRVKGDFVFSDAHQRVPYTFMVVSPREELPFDGTDVLTNRRVARVRDPEPLPAGVRMVERVAVPGYARQEFPGYLDPAAGLIAVQDGLVDVLPPGCQVGRPIAVSRAVSATFEPHGHPALVVEPALTEVRTAGLLTMMYASAQLGTVRTRTEAVLPRTIPYDITNHIVLDSDVLVLHRRQKRFGWPGCHCGQFGCICWSEPYGTVAHRTFTLDVSDRGVYYDSQLALSTLDAYYDISGGKPLGGEVTRLAHIDTRTRTRALDAKPVGLLRTIWRTRAESEVYDEVAPVSLYAQPQAPGEIPSSWGPMTLADSGSWSGSSRALHGCSGAGSTGQPSLTSAPSVKSASSADPAPGTTARRRPPVNLPVGAVGFSHRSLAFSTGAARGLFFTPQMRQIEALSHSHSARHGKRPRPVGGTLAQVRPHGERDADGHDRPGPEGSRR